MLFVLSPAKSLDYESIAPDVATTVPRFMRDSQKLVDLLRAYSPSDLSSLMSISDSLGTLNALRFAEWSIKPTVKNSKAAVFAFNGDVYEGLDAASLPNTALPYLSDRLRILSGLYGVLRPFDLLQAYRLEMGTKLPNGKGKDLYAFWGDAITSALNEDLTKLKSDVLVNLASEEYFKSVKKNKLVCPIVTPVFEDYKNGQYKIISFYAKRARGLMMRYACENGIDDVHALKAFDTDGYQFMPDLSTEHAWLFRRG